LSESGYTLLELLLVLAIMSIFLAAAAPSMHGFLSSSKLEGKASRVAADMRLVRQSAISSGQDCRLVFHLEENCYILQLPEGKELVEIPEGVSLKSTNFPEKQKKNGIYHLGFTPTGAPSRGGRLKLQNREGEEKYVIVTVATGRVRVSPDPP